jgi:DNA repair protein RecO (recombination protein O)
METVSSEAFVLARHPLTESSWIVTLFTREAGSLRAVAKGARRLKSPLLGALEPMNRVRVEVARKEHAGLGQLRAADLEEGVLDLYGRWPCAAVLMAAAETLHRGLPEQSPEEETYRLTGALVAGLRDGVPPALAWLYFAAWFLRLHGVLPPPDACVSCGSPPGAPLHYDAGAGGWLCAPCRRTRPPQGVEVGAGATALLREILRRPPGQVPPGSAAERSALRSVVYLGLAAFLGRPLASWEPLEKLDADDAGSG